MTGPRSAASAGGAAAGPVCDPDELRTLFLFEQLSDDQIAELCRVGHIETIPPGPVFAEGEPAKWFYVLIEGTVAITRKVGGDDVEYNRTSQRGVYNGAFQAYLGDRMPQVYGNSMRVTETSRFYVMSAEDFARIINEWFPMAVHLLEGLFLGGRAAHQALGQRERLLALGALSAGLTHELNNPATAVVRAVGGLRERLLRMRNKLTVVAATPEERAALEAIVQLEQRAVDGVGTAAPLDALAASDAEDEVTDWLEEHGIDDGWQMASAFVLAGVDPDWLEEARSAVRPELLEGTVRWVNHAVAVKLLLDEIAEAVTRISTLVGAAKQYSQLDRAPYHEVDVHALLDSTLLMLSGKIPEAVTVVKDYDRALPRIQAYAAELNQVWTNLIDNAVDAMDGAGTLTIRTALADEFMLVEFCDTGPGIAADVQHRIFEPFFTTKPVGKGTGLGLDISYRIVVNKHHGDLRVESAPGDTRFQVILPLQPPAGGPAREREPA